MANRDFVVRKTPDEKFGVGFRYLPPDLKVGETISGATAYADTGLSKADNCTINGNEVSIVVWGGVANQRYKVTLKVTTSVGFIFEDTLIVHVV